MDLETCRIRSSRLKNGAKISISIWNRIEKNNLIRIRVGVEHQNQKRGEEKEKTKTETRFYLILSEIQSESTNEQMTLAEDSTRMHDDSFHQPFNAE